MISVKVRKSWRRWDGRGRLTKIVWSTSGLAHLAAAWCLDKDGGMVWEYVMLDLVEGWGHD